MCKFIYQNSPQYILNLFQVSSYTKYEILFYAGQSLNSSFQPHHLGKCASHPSTPISKTPLPLGVIAHLSFPCETILFSSKWRLSALRLNFPNILKCCSSIFILYGIKIICTHLPNPLRLDNS